ncbi:hypothetical protein WJX73_010570 [Symbiochloris irregularis]|uniref:Uncharacterized protein n=1 Tax=Symbiochloris irregularis TaxID=706552 RepID=A0AAW1P0E2_9CHLO
MYCRVPRALRGSAGSLNEAACRALIAFISALQPSDTFSRRKPLHCNHPCSTVTAQLDLSDAALCAVSTERCGQRCDITESKSACKPESESTATATTFTCTTLCLSASAPSTGSNPLTITAAITVVVKSQPSRCARFTHPRSTKPNKVRSQQPKQPPSFDPHPRGHAGPLPTATSSSPGVDTGFAVSASVPVSATPVAGGGASSTAAGATIEPTPAVQAAIANANIPASSKQVASAIATQTTCPPDNKQSITLPLDGSVLATHTGQTCGTLAAVPEALQSAVQGGYTVTLSGDREDHTGATVTSVTVSLAGGSNQGTFTLPQNGGTTWGVMTNGYNFAVNSSSITVAVNGQNYTDSSASVFGIQLTINKCTSQMPVADATVHALLTGFNAVDQPLALVASSSSSNVYSSVLNMGNMFPNLGYTNQATLNYCTANQANLRQACTAGMQNGHNFSESGVLLNSCTKFLTDGALANVSSAARQVAVACAVMAVEMSLICTSSTTDCDAVASKTFTISVAAQENVAGGPSNRTIAAFGTIYQNMVNGKPGDDIIHVDNISCSDIADGSCGPCSSAQPAGFTEVAGQ